MAWHGIKIKENGQHVMAKNYVVLIFVRIRLYCIITCDISLDNKPQCIIYITCIHYVTYFRSVGVYL